MKAKFLDTLNERVILCDGAMGTEIYRRGVFINQCYENLNIANPALIKEIHEDYVRAGSEVIETNTFGANRIKLQKFGLEDRVGEINVKGVELARRAAGEACWIAGSVGPTGREIAPIGILPEEEARSAFKEQISALVGAGIDILFLETFTNIRELEIAYLAARESSRDIPIAAQVAFRYFGEGKFAGPTPDETAKIIETWDVQIMGTNCGNGPRGILDCVEKMAANLKTKKLSAMPNAGLPEVVRGMTIYMTTPEYFAEYIRRMIQKNVTVVGGCCGIRPEHIKEANKFIRSITPRKVIEFIEKKDENVAIEEPVPIGKRTPFGEKLNKKFLISVEIDPPHGLNPGKAVEAVKLLHANGVDAVNIADGPRAVARMSAIALGIFLRDIGIDIIIHYACRDRNLLGIQMDLIGANALGIRNLLAVTGDPPKMGNYPDATAVFDIDSIGLIRLVQNLNRGLDFASKPLGDKTSFVVGSGFNPGAINIDLEAERFLNKTEAGAEFFFTQPVYDPELLENFLKKIKNSREVPIFAGILPLASYRNAEFLHNEVPGMQIPASIMKRMASANTKDAQRKEGILIAQEALKSAIKLPRVKGAYIFPSLGHYESVIEIMKVL
ncbi:MAG TPA: bifunctional homocysteine S-methyltransferase/methylenetetrahydrofolate reductase [bacterium]